MLRASEGYASLARREFRNERAELRRERKPELLQFECDGLHIQLEYTKDDGSREVAWFTRTSAANGAR